MQVWWGWKGLVYGVEGKKNERGWERVCEEAKAGMKG